MIDSLRRILLRDLEALRREVRAYDTDDQLWATPPGAPNSGGTLALHLVGNLRHFIGAQLGQTGYVRDRSAEFADRGASRTDIEERIDRAIEEVGATLEALDPGILAVDYPLEVGGTRLPTGLFLLHLATHFAYHQGQVDYHRRLVTGRSDGVSAQSVPELRVG